jgi:membrane protease YdiL (CAAX protease family)
MPSRRTAILYVVLSLGFAFLYWFLVVTAPEAMKKSEWAVVSTWGTIAWAVLRAFGPLVAGVLALAICRGRGAVADLGRSVVRWRVAPRLWLLGLFPILLNGVALLVSAGQGTLHFEPRVTVVRAVMFFFLMAILDGPLGEEVGWRGVLLPQLLETVRPLPAAVLVGIVWYAWHIPLYAADAKGMSPAAHALFAASCIALSIVFTWFWLQSKGSTLFAIYLHDCSNYFIFVRMKTFTVTGDSQWPRVAYFAVLVIITALAAVRLVTDDRRVGERRAYATRD